ncbi:DotI/IcmL family type IV secretion protein [Geopseudomonas aromaticivorans]
MQTNSDDQLVAGLLVSNRVLLYVVMFLSVAVIALIVGMSGLGWYTTKKIDSIKREYFASGPNGNLYQLTPMDQPMGGDERAINFSTNCLYKATRLDYVNYKRQLSETERECFTGEGYKSFYAALERAKIIDQLNSPKAQLVLSSNIGPGEFLAREPRVYFGISRMTYSIKYPIEIVFNGDLGRPFKGMLEADVLRIDETQRPEGLAIHAIRISKR